VADVKIVAFHSEAFMRASNGSFRGVLGFPVALLALSAALDLAACSSTVSDAGLTTTTGGGCSGGCPSGEVCMGNQCVSSCTAAGGTLCGTACVNTQSDNANCGACAMACTSGQACSAGKCAATCAPGYDVCTTDGGFYCAVLAGDNNNCGTCGKICPSGQYCSMGTCTPQSTSCPQGQTLCQADAGFGDGGPGGGSCVNLQADNNNCGSCGHACGAGESCLAASCQSGPACPNGLLACPNATGGSTCVAYLIDPSNCGGCNKSCGENGICTQGACACPGLYTQCGTTAAPSCAALQFDTANCGSCGLACVACSTCTLGACTPESFLTAAAEGLPVLDAGATGYGAVISADFNGDGVTDLAMLQGTSVLVALVSDGGFGPYFTLPVNVGLYGSEAMAAGDFNNDGIADIAVSYTTGSYSAELAVYFGSASSGFTPYGPFPVAMSSYSITGVATGDFNADTFGDIAVVQGYGANGLSVFYSNGMGGFTAVGGLPGDIGGGYVGYIAVTSGDINGDGVSDVVMSFTSYGASSSPLLEVLFGSDAGIGSSNAAKVSATLAGALAVQGAEIDAFATGQLLPYVWDSDGGLKSAGTYNIAAAPYSAPSVAAAQDMNSDGLVDIVALEGSSVFVWLRDDGGYGTPLSVVAGAGGMAVADLNGDGKADVASTNGSYVSPGGVILLNSCQ
jgi:hypothetical protein